MSTEFSIVNMRNLNSAQKSAFYKALVDNLESKKAEIETDDILNRYSQYLINLDQITDADNIIDDIYSALTAGIQVGSGNQSLYLCVLNGITDSWKTVSELR